MVSAARCLRCSRVALFVKPFLRRRRPYLTELVVHAHVVAGGRGGRPRIIAAAQHLVRLPYSPEAFGRASLIGVVDPSEADGRSLTSFAVKGLRDEGSKQSSHVGLVSRLRQSAPRSPRLLFIPIQLGAVRGSLSLPFGSAERNGNEPWCCCNCNPLLQSS